MEYHRYHNGVQASATAYSIAETAKANNLKPHEYFRYLLTELAERVDIKMDAQFTLEVLMPWSPTLPEECHRKICNQLPPQKRRLAFVLDAWFTIYHLIEDQLLKEMGFPKN